MRFLRLIAVVVLIAAGSPAWAACSAKKLQDNVAAGEAIGGGHAFTEHVNPGSANGYNEFANGRVISGLGYPNATVATKSEFATLVSDIMWTTVGKTLVDHRTAYWHAATGTVVITNVNDADCGTAFRPGTGKTYYDNLH